MPEIDHNSTTLDAPISHRLKELAWVFTKLGIIGFGGPAAHIAMIEAEVVTRRQWLSRDQLIDLLGITNLLPGPNSTEVVIHIGLLRAGWRGLVVAGVCFILPAMLLVWGLAIGYGQYQTLPQVEAMLYGIKPVIIGMIAQAVWKLGNSVLKGRFMVLITALLLGLIFLQVHEILLLIIAGLLVVGWEALRTKYQLSIS
ncbi:MAG: chromate transporter, partial [Pseudanabaena sp. ELA607]